MAGARVVGEDEGGSALHADTFRVTFIAVESSAVCVETGSVFEGEVGIAGSADTSSSITIGTGT